MKYFNHYFLVTGNYHGSIHVLINLSSLYQSLVQLIEHDRAISYPLNSNLLNILLLRGSGSRKRGRARGGPLARPWAFKFFRPSPAQPVDRSTGLKDRPDSGLRPNFSGPGGSARPVGDL